MKRILVTGSKGFIGGAMLDKLMLNDDIFVVGYDLREKDDYEPNIEHVRQIIEASNIDTVMHFGALSSTTEKDLDKVLRFNYDFTRDLIDICYEKDILLQFSSSASVYGNSEDNTYKETDAVQPKNAYALSKYLCERYAMDKIMNYGAKIQIFRYFNVWSNSRREHHKGNQASPQYRFDEAIRKDEKIKLFEGSHCYERDFIWYMLVIDIQFAFLDIDRDGIWNIGTGKTKSFVDVAKEYCNHQGVSFHDVVEIIEFPDELREHYQTYTCADTTKLFNTLKEFGKYDELCTNNWLF